MSAPDQHPPTEADLSSWVITGAASRQQLAQRVTRCVGEVRRLRAALTLMEREVVKAAGEIVRVRDCSSGAGR